MAKWQPNAVKYIAGIILCAVVAVVLSVVSLAFLTKLFIGILVGCPVM